MKLEFIFKQVDEILEKQYTTEKTKDLTEDEAVVEALKEILIPQ